MPLLLGFTYYIFDFGLLRKAVLTAMTMLHLAVFLPFQVLTQALVLQKTVLFMPVLYIVFGMPLDVLLIIAFYSWGMTWSFRPAGKRQPKLGSFRSQGLEPALGTAFEPCDPATDEPCLARPALQHLNGFLHLFILLRRLRLGGLV